ncbi:DUF4012 domain-containing protein [Microbacterium pseudoresistens]
MHRKRTQTKPRRRLGLWISLGALLFVLIAIVAIGGWLASQIYGQADRVRAHLDAALSHVSEVQQGVMDGDFDSASVAAEQFAEETGSARAEAQGRLWSFAESLPVGLADDLVAVRLVAESADQLARDVVQPMSSVDLAALVPRGGAIDVGALAQLSGLLDQAEAGARTALESLDPINRENLIGPVSAGVTKLENALNSILPMLQPMRDVLEVLPEALGSPEPKNYLLMFQGTSEARSLGGNAAVFLVLHADNGVVSIVQRADSSDFSSRADPIVPLNPESVAIYGDKIGRYTPDPTMVPDFTEATSIILGFWADRFDMTFDGVISIDPVALAYVLGATGPVQLPTGDTLSAANATSLLLNEVYFRYETNLEQNAFFAAAADAVYTAVTNGPANPVAFISAIARGADEGRILYRSNDERQTELIAGSRMSGVMPQNNSDSTVLGVYVNDNTGSKKSYYLDMAIEASSTRCEAEPAEYSGAVTLSSSLSADIAGRLPPYIKGPYFAAEEISTYVVLYGPVGGALDEVLIDGAPAPVLSAGQHLGRPAVKVEVSHWLESSHTIAFRFHAAEASSELGPLNVWHTPMSRATSVAITEPGCS